MIKDARWGWIRIQGNEVFSFEVTHDFEWLRPDIASTSDMSEDGEGNLIVWMGVIETHLYWTIFTDINKFVETYNALK